MLKLKKHPVFKLISYSLLKLVTVIAAAQVRFQLSQNIKTNSIAEEDPFEWSWQFRLLNSQVRPCSSSSELAVGLFL